MQTQREISVSWVETNESRGKACKLRIENFESRGCQCTSTKRYDHIKSTNGLICSTNE